MRYTELTHFSHPHILKPETEQTPFTCDGCKEAGCGLRFRCAECNYDLHKDCALAPPYITHPFYDNCSFRFHNRGQDDTLCKACEKLTLGFVYTGGHRSLHPCCANLQTVIEKGSVELRLQKRVWTSKCVICQSRNLGKNLRRVGGWSYRSASKEHHYHVYCLKKQADDKVVKRWEKDGLCGEMDIAAEFPEMINRSGSAKITNKSMTMDLNILFSIVLGYQLAVYEFFVSLDSV